MKKELNPETINTIEQIQTIWEATIPETAPAELSPEERRNRERVHMFADAVIAAIGAINAHLPGALRVSISAKNIKMGDISSVSLPPLITCPGARCWFKCYASKIAALRPSVRRAYARNLAILIMRPALFWEQVRAYAAACRFFRFNVSGDIPAGELGRAYFAGVIETAKRCPGCTFLMFTKRFDTVNAAIDAGGPLPENLRVIFSGWGPAVQNNPHRLPESNVIFRGEEPRENWKICPGNCFTCAARGVGCWELKNGETIAFHEH